MIAALYVQTGGVYYGLDDVDPWDEARDARTYDGPYPVVAHPPCARWCRLAALVESRYGYTAGEDGGLFASALAAVRRWGGVLEHPAYSTAWAKYGLMPPPRAGGWWRAGLLDEGWCAHVEQGRYGHPAKKATWLYAVRCDLPSLRWGSMPDHAARAIVSWCGNNIRPGEQRPRLRSREAARTPVEFRDVLLAMARSVAA
jgi:hypothetical protein